MIRNSVKYISLICGTYAAFEIVLNASVIRGLELPARNPIHPRQWIVDERVMSPREWRIYLRRPDVIIALTYVFVVGGSTVTLPSDFNIMSNVISCVGAGQGGGGGQSGSVGSGAGAGAAGGGGGAFASVTNYSAHSGGAVVNVQVGTFDTWFDSSSVVLAKAAVQQIGGQASACVGSVKFSGGNGGNGGNPGDPSGMGGGGGGGGGAAGPNGPGINGANGIVITGSGQQSGGVGGAGDSGNTPGGATPGGSPGASGTQFDATHGCGGGGTGSNGGGFYRGTNDAQSPGGAAGSYGAGGGGGGGGGWSSGTGSGNGGTGGNSYQGLIAIAYTQASLSRARTFAIIIG